MLLRPRNGNIVVYCEAAKIRLYSAGDWDRGDRHSPLAELSPTETTAIMNFVRRWGAGRHGPVITRDPEVDVRYDY